MLANIELKCLWSGVVCVCLSLLFYLKVLFSMFAKWSSCFCMIDTDMYNRFSGNTGVLKSESSIDKLAVANVSLKMNDEAD